LSESLVQTTRVGNELAGEQHREILDPKSDADHVGRALDTPSSVLDLASGGHEPAAPASLGEGGGQDAAGTAA
jgi:hypothetical protein